MVDPFEPPVPELLQQTPTMPTTVITKRISWERGLTMLKDRVRMLRPFYLPPDPCSRTDYDPGHRAVRSLFPPTPVAFGAVQGGRRPRPSCRRGSGK